MQELSFYQNIMNECSDNINKLNTEVNQYNSLISKLRALLSNYPEIKDYLSSAEEQYLSGAYIDHLGPFDQGKLGDGINILDTDTSIIEKVIADLEGKITECNSLISNYRNEYENAKANYDSCLNRMEA